MATLLPPPKRQKSAYSQSLKPRVTPPPETPIPSVVVQFKNAEDGSSLGPAINLPADTGRDALQMLVNKLRGEVSYIRFDDESADGGRARIHYHIPSTWFRGHQMPLECRSITPSWSMHLHLRKCLLQQLRCSLPKTCLSWYASHKLSSESEAWEGVVRL